MKTQKSLSCLLSAHEQGSSLIELALVMPIFLLLLVGAVDFGQAYYASIEVSSAADAGTAYGMTNPTDTGGMTNAATLDANDIQGISATATWGCECSDGTAASQSCSTTPSCAVTVVKYVDVKTTWIQRTILNYPTIPSSFALAGHSRMRVSGGNASGVLVQ